LLLVLSELLSVFLSEDFDSESDFVSVLESLLSAGVSVRFFFLSPSLKSHFSFSTDFTICWMGVADLLQYFDFIATRLAKEFINWHIYNSLKHINLFVGNVWPNRFEYKQIELYCFK